MTDRKKIIKEYKQTVQPMGIFQIRNMRTGKIFIGSSMNLNAIINRFNFNHNIGWHISSQLKEDFEQYGPENLIIEIIDKLEAKDDPEYDYHDDLAELERMWIDKLQPFDEKGYNKKELLRN